jgi:hypothetical protein
MKYHVKPCRMIQSPAWRMVSRVEQMKRKNSDAAESSVLAFRFVVWLKKYKVTALFRKAIRRNIALSAFATVGEHLDKFGPIFSC